MRAGAVLALFLVGCSSGPRPIIDNCPGSAADLCAWRKLPGQELAERVAWVHAWGMKTPIPELRPLTGAALNCGGGLKFLILDSNGAEVCVRGIYYPSRRAGYFAAEYGDATRLDRTSLVHELMHGRLADLKIHDEEHSHDDWRAGGLLDLTKAVIASVLYRTE